VANEELTRQLDRVLQSATTKQRVLKEFDNYSKGMFDAPFLPSQGQSALAREYRSLATRSELPICGLIVSAVTNRLLVDGIRDANGDMNDEMWDWWQQSKLDSRQLQLYSDALVFGDGYLSVVPSEDGTYPLMMPESPLHLAAVHDPIDPLKVRYAAKAVDDFAWLYTDEAIYSFRRGTGAQRWILIDTVRHPLGVCPIVRFPNKLDSAGRSESEIAQVLPIQRRINQTIYTRLLLEAAAAWRQRWVSGIDVDSDENGDPVPPFRMSVDKLLVAPDPDTKFGEFQASSTADLLSAVENDLRHAAVVTQTPPTLFAANSISNISAESLAVLEGGLTRKVEAKQQAFGEAFEYAQVLGGALMGREVGFDIEVVWSNMELQSMAQKSNAFVQLRSAGLPVAYLLESIMGLTPQAIANIESMLASEANMSATAQATAFGVGVPGAANATEATVNGPNAG
jgi:hypothetical protein